MVDQKSVREYSFTDQSLVQGKTYSIDQHYPIDWPHWSLGQVWQLAGKTWLAWMSGTQLVIAELAHGTAKTRAFEYTFPPERLANYTRIAFTVPAIERYNDTLFWTDSRALHRFVTANHDYQTDALPKLTGTYRATPIYGNERVEWLVMGGPTGELSELGFYCLSNPNQRGQGITTRFAMDPLNQGRRFVVFSVPASVGSQVMSALSGSQKITCCVFQHKQSNWTKTHSMTFKFDSDERSEFQKVSFEFGPDFNADQLADVLVSDGSKTLKVYLSTSDGGLSSRPEYLDSAADLVFVGQPYAIGLDHQNNQWTWKKITP